MATESLYSGKYSKYLDQENNSTTSNVENSTISNVESTSPNNNNTYTGKYSEFVDSSTTYAEPSSTEKMLYGASSETWLLGDFWRLSKAGVQSLYSGKSFSDERKEEEQLRLENVFKNTLGQNLVRMIMMLQYGQEE